MQREIPSFWFPEPTGLQIPVNTPKGVKFSESCMVRDVALPFVIIGGITYDWRNVYENDYILIDRFDTYEEFGIIMDDKSNIKKIKCFNPETNDITNPELLNNLSNLRKTNYDEYTKILKSQIN